MPISPYRNAMPVRGGMGRLRTRYNGRPSRPSRRAGTFRGERVVLVTAATSVAHHVRQFVISAQEWAAFTQRFRVDSTGDLCAEAYEHAISMLAQAREIAAPGCTKEPSECYPLCAHIANGRVVVVDTAVIIMEEWEEEEEEEEDLSAISTDYAETSDTASEYTLSDTE